MSKTQNEPVSLGGQLSSFNVKNVNMASHSNLPLFLLGNYFQNYDNQPCYTASVPPIAS